jgi:hypothetical protein
LKALFALAGLEDKLAALIVIDIGVSDNPIKRQALITLGLAVDAEKEEIVQAMKAADMETMSLPSEAEAVEYVNQKSVMVKAERSISWHRLYRQMTSFQGPDHRSLEGRVSGWKAMAEVMADWRGVS